MEEAGFKGRLKGKYGEETDRKKPERKRKGRKRSERNEGGRSEEYRGRFH